MLDWCDSLSRLSRLPLIPSRLSLSLSLLHTLSFSLSVLTVNSPAIPSVNAQRREWSRARCLTGSIPTQAMAT
jgi:hypothetical protein